MIPKEQLRALLHKPRPAKFTRGEHYYLRHGGTDQFASVTVEGELSLTSDPTQALVFNDKQKAQSYAPAKSRWSAVSAHRVGCNYTVAARKVKSNAASELERTTEKTTVRYHITEQTINWQVLINAAGRLKSMLVYAGLCGRNCLMEHQLIAALSRTYLIPNPPKLCAFGVEWDADALRDAAHNRPTRDCYLSGTSFSDFVHHNHILSANQRSVRVLQSRRSTPLKLDILFYDTMNTPTVEHVEEFMYYAVNNAANDALFFVTFVNRFRSASGDASAREFQAEYNQHTDDMAKAVETVIIEQVQRRTGVHAQTVLSAQYIGGVNTPIVTLGFQLSKHPVRLPAIRYTTATDEARKAKNNQHKLAEDVFSLAPKVFKSTDAVWVGDRQYHELELVNA